MYIYIYIYIYIYNVVTVSVLADKWSTGFKTRIVMLFIFSKHLTEILFKQASRDDEYILCK